jgi:RNA polymerase sigma-70 factor, ECF subfamily
VEIILQELFDDPHTPLSDLVQHAQAGDAAAFEQLYRAHVGRIYALCLRMVADASRAQSLTQDAFVRAWQQLGAFRHESAFGTWLHRLAVNVVLNDLRSERRRSARFLTTDDLELFEGNGREPSPDTGMDLEAGISSLPPQARSVMVLYDIEGYTHDEIGAAMGIAPGTSKAHLHRARQLLQAAMAPNR